MTWQRNTITKITKEMRAANRADIYVGIVEKSVRKHGKDVVSDANIAMWLTEGTKINDKQWPFLREGVEQTKYDTLVKSFFRNAAFGSSTDMVERFGHRASLRVKQRMKSMKEPKLEASTIARKGSSDPLIDTAQLQKNINSKVVK